MSVADTPSRIRELLAPLAPAHVSLDDESHRHVGHAGAAGGGGHYRLTIVSPQFAGMSALARHRKVFAQLGSLMQREIHALSITALTPDEATRDAASQPISS